MACSNDVLWPSILPSVKLAFDSVEENITYSEYCLTFGCDRGIKIDNCATYKSSEVLCGGGGKDPTSSSAITRLQSASVPSVLLHFGAIARDGLYLLAVSPLSFHY